MNSQRLRLSSLGRILLGLLLVVVPANLALAEVTADSKTDCSKPGNSNNKDCTKAEKKTPKNNTDKVTEDRLSTRGLKPPPKDETGKDAKPKSSSASDTDKPKQ